MEMMVGGGSLRPLSLADLHDRPLAVPRQAALALTDRPVTEEDSQPATPNLRRSMSGFPQPFAKSASPPQQQDMENSQDEAADVSKDGVEDLLDMIETRRLAKKAEATTKSEANGKATTKAKAKAKTMAKVQPEAPARKPKGKAKAKNKAKAAAEKQPQEEEPGAEAKAKKKAKAAVAEVKEPAPAPKPEAKAKAKMKAAAEKQPQEEESEAEAKAKKKAKAAVAKAKAKKKAKAAVVEEEEPPVPPLVLGCGRCRYSANGCSTCKNPNFKGVRGNAAQV